MLCPYEPPLIKRLTKKVTNPLFYSYFIDLTISFLCSQGTQFQLLRCVDLAAYHLSSLFGFLPTHLGIYTSHSSYPNISFSRISNPSTQSYSALHLSAIALHTFKWRPRSGIVTQMHIVLLRVLCVLFSRRTPD